MNENPTTPRPDDEPGRLPEHLTGEIDRSIYPMPQFVTLRAADPGRSARWYEGAAGFVVLATLQAGPGELVHLRRWRYQDVLLVTGVPAPGDGVRVNVSAGTDDDLDERARRAVELGGRIVEGPVRRPYNVVELVLADPDGYQLVLFRPVPPAEADQEFSRQVLDSVRPPRGGA